MDSKEVHDICSFLPRREKECDGGRYIGTLFNPLGRHWFNFVIRDWKLHDGSHSHYFNAYVNYFAHLTIVD